MPCSLLHKKLTHAELTHAQATAESVPLPSQALSRDVKSENPKRHFKLRGKTHLRIQKTAWATLGFSKLQFSGGRWAELGLILLGIWEQDFRFLQVVASGGL